MGTVTECRSKVNKSGQMDIFITLAGVSDTACKQQDTIKKDEYPNNIP
jgi:hypothetical protein